jgi:hypothetical protein
MQNTSTPRNHPFDGPEVFDDFMPREELMRRIAAVNARAEELMLKELDPYPLTTRAVDALKARRTS